MSQDPNCFKLSKSISMIYRNGKAYIDQAMSHHDIGSGQYIFLFYLFNHNGSTQDEISKALDMDKATTTRALQKLETSGLVKRDRNEIDHRINNVFITDAGNALRKELYKVAMDWDDILLQNLSDEERSTLQTLICKLSDNSKAYRKQNN
ncbi:MAG: MarR family transcriptional regulator [Clostridiales bacterium]|jgi:DNA-binding MarR family transcriptional regulator|nr:MarR family transcriptional regulator [Clostridiales bacterium]